MTKTMLAIFLTLGATQVLGAEYKCFSEGQHEMIVTTLPEGQLTRTSPYDDATVIFKSIQDASQFGAGNLLLTEKKVGNLSTQITYKNIQGSILTISESKVIGRGGGGGGGRGGCGRGSCDFEMTPMGGISALVKPKGAEVYNGYYCYKTN